MRAVGAVAARQPLDEHGSIERYHRIPGEELLHARSWTSEAQRAEAITVWNVHYNYHRAPHRRRQPAPASRRHTSVTNVQRQDN